MTKILVASTNPVKIQAALHGFQAIFPELEADVAGVAAHSGVPDQPFGDEETRRGAANRVRYVAKAYPDTDYVIGIEGGCTCHRDGKVSVYAWVVIEALDGTLGQSKTGTFYLPEEVARLVQDGMELGDADDVIFGKSNSKQSTGSVGLLTGDVVTRTDYYVHAVILALIPFKNRKFTF